MVGIQLFVSALLTLTASTSAQVQESIVNPTTAASTATPLPSASGYAYVGCFNETTGVPNTGGARALAGGNSVSKDVPHPAQKARLPQVLSPTNLPPPQSATNTLTPLTCLTFCSDTQFFGLEYGRECYCANYLSSFSVKLNESRCNYACNGNSSEICGGSLALTLYNRTGDARTGGGAGRLLGNAGVGMVYGVAGLGMLVLAAVL